ncbi:MAG TPA: hypothetical protein PKW98_07095 [Candidatus Wallbacteria bacterium]|nr:MAG: hypothetical protein BWY32_00970 [bacterium ADurb.Bin243]HOD39799.1 hypothetical protein [Candidatus Wallbacteria bacterium]HPG57566.1 hypothetical protein [Candidatus Wallbacteria bacterium]
MADNQYNSTIAKYFVSSGRGAFELARAAACFAAVLLCVFCGAAHSSAAKLETDNYAVESFKKLRSRDIVLTIEKGTVYIMVGPNRWDAAKNNVKLITGDKLKVVPGTIASVNFYDEFDIHLPESELTTIEPAGITQLINEALFRTTYKDGTYVSDVVREPSRLAQYKFRGAIKNRDLKLEYSKNKIAKKSNAEVIERVHKEREENNYLRGRVMQARNFGNGFTLDYLNAESKINNDNRINSCEREKQRIERDVYAKMSQAASLTKIIIKRKADGVSAAAEEAQLNALNASLRDITQELEYININLRGINEEQNKLNLTPKAKEW